MGSVSGFVIVKDRGTCKDGLNQPMQEAAASRRDRLAEFDKGELRGPVDAQIELPSRFDLRVSI